MRGLFFYTFLHLSSIFMLRTDYIPLAWGTKLNTELFQRPDVVIDVLSLGMLFFSYFRPRLYVVACLISHCYLRQRHVKRKRGATSRYHWNFFTKRPSKRIKREKIKSKWSIIKEVGENERYTFWYFHFNLLNYIIIR